MMKRIMTPRAAAVAFAASALFAAPALADPSKEFKSDHSKRSVSTAVHFDVGNGLAITLANGDWERGHRGWHNNRGYYGNRHYGHQDRYRTKQLRREAVRLCRRAVKRTSYDNGFPRVYLDEVEHIERIGPRGFAVHAEFEFEGRRRDFERDVTCIVRRGRVVDIDNLPRGRGRRNAGYGDHGNDYLKGDRRYGY